MKTLTTPVTNESQASQSAWCELYDLYLKAPIATPWGTVDTLRLTDLPGGIAFFTPKLDPEPAGTRGNAQVYNFWPLKRDKLKTQTQSANDRITIVASNVTTEFVAMVDLIDWQDTPIVIRKIPISAVGLTADDCGILLIGLLDAPEDITNEKLQFPCSNDLVTFATELPRELMHQNCRARWGDDLCTSIKYHADHYKTKTVKVGSTASVILSDDFTEDTGSDSTYGTDMVNALADGAITASSHSTGLDPFKVKTSYNATGYWGVSDQTQWGDLTQGYWTIKSGQEGLANPALTPYIQFDFGSAKTPRIWQFVGVLDVGKEHLVRLIVIFSSTNGTDWKHESYFEGPPRGGIFYDVLIPKASTARYWRICVRTRWGEKMFEEQFYSMLAFEGSRNWWADGMITFSPATTTVALRNVTRLVRESYAGKAMVVKLPAAPVAGDTFIVSRGCGRTFNACCERRNWENFAGFDTMNYQLTAHAF